MSSVVISSSYGMSSFWCHIIQQQPSVIFDVVIFIPEDALEEAQDKFPLASKLGN